MATKKKPTKKAAKKPGAKKASPESVELEMLRKRLAELEAKAAPSPAETAEEPENPDDGAEEPVDTPAPIAQPHVLAEAAPAVAPVSVVDPIAETMPAPVAPIVAPAVAPAPPIVANGLNGAHHPEVMEPLPVPIPYANGVSPVEALPVPDPLPLPIAVGQPAAPAPIAAAPHAVQPVPVQPAPAAPAVIQQSPEQIEQNPEQSPYEQAVVAETNTILMAVESALSVLDMPLDPTIRLTAIYHAALHWTAQIGLDIGRSLEDMTSDVASMVADEQARRIRANLLQQMQQPVQ